MIALGILGVLLALFVGLSMQAGTYFLFRMLTDGLGKVPSMFLSAFLALVTRETVNYVSTANPLQQETRQERAALDQRLAGQGLCVAMLMPIWMLYDFFRKPKMRADATEKPEGNSQPEGEHGGKQRRDEADARRRLENERRKSEREAERRESEREAERRESERRESERRESEREVERRRESERRESEREAERRKGESEAERRKGESEAERRKGEREAERRESLRNPPRERAATQAQPGDIHPVAGLTVLLVIVVAVAVALALVSRQSTHERSSSRTPSSATRSGSVPSPVTPPAFEPTPTRPQEATEVVPVPTENAMRPSPTEPVQIHSEPAGADVLMAGGILLGVTPLEVPRPADGQVAVLTLRLRGYREATIGLTEFSPRMRSQTLVRLGSPRPSIAPRGDEGLEASQIREVIRAARPQLNECWETELRLLAVGPVMERQRVAGRPLQIDVDLAIDGSGVVVDVLTRGDSVGGLSACIRATVERWHFPAAGGQTRTSFPLVTSES